MSTLKHLKIIQKIYDARAPVYDLEGGFHLKQQADYLKWMDLKPGDDVLDLACGTGLLAISAKEIVGPLGRVVGVDISPASLGVAKSKVISTGLDVEFFESDICAFPDAESSFEKLGEAAEEGGKLIFDVPTKDSMVRGVVLEQAAHKLNVPVASNRGQFDSLEKVKKLLTNAGLDASESFDSQNYDGPQELDSSRGGELLQEMVAAGKWSSGWYEELNKSEARDAVKDCFSKELSKIADKDGKVKS